MQVTGNKTGYHAVPSANAVYHFAFWGANAVHRTGFIQQQGTIARHAYQNIACTTLLQFPGSLGNLFITIELFAKDLTQFMVVGFDQKRVVGQYLYQQITGGIHHKADAAAIQPSQNLLVNILRHAGRNAAGKYQNVTLAQFFQIVPQGLHGFGSNVRAGTVDLGLFCALYLNVDSGHAVRQADEAGFQAGKLQAALQPGTSFASCKAKGDAFAPKLPQNAGNIDTLAAKLAGFV